MSPARMLLATAFTLSACVSAAPPRFLPPPPPPPPVASAPHQALERFPVVEGPAEWTAGEEQEVLVSLAEEELTPDVGVVAGGGATKGSLALPLPELPAEAAGWPIKVTLAAGAFDIVGKNAATFLLPRTGMSGTASFLLRARAPVAEARIYAVFMYEGAFLGRVVKTVRIAPSAGAQASRPAAAGPALAPASAGPVTQPRVSSRGPGLSVDQGLEAADLTITLVVGSDPSRRRLAVVTTDAPGVGSSYGTWELPVDQGRVLAANFGAFAGAARGLRPSAGAAPVALKPSPEAMVEQVRGFGMKQWNGLPSLVREAVRAVQAKKGDAFETILILTNEPSVPWELLVDDSGEFLGTRYLMARWYLAEGGGIRARPASAVQLEGLTVIAPDYAGGARLPSQALELAALEETLGGRVQRSPGTLEAVRRSLHGRRPGVLHFAGHGEVAGSEAAPRYVLRLSDGELTSDGWLGAAGKGEPWLVFLNACDLGQSDRVAGTVDGWAPVVLDGGAAGYIGGLWPLGDRAAAEFARRFYGAVSVGAPVAEALRSARLAFYTTGDPTYLAYVFYGDPHLRLGLGGR